MQKQCVSCLVLLGGAFLLAGCSGGASEALGLGRHSPDEFAVVDRAPLSLPPNYDLRPPRPGAQRPQEIEMTKRASQILYGEKGTSGDAVSSSSLEQSVLHSAEAEKASPAIRETIDREADERVVGSRRLVDDLLWWRDPADNEATVNAPAEAKRLREAQKEAKPVNSEPTPIIEKNRSGWLF